MEGAVEDDFGPVVLHVFAVHFLLVIGGVVFAGFVGVVAAAVFVDLG